MPRHRSASKTPERQDKSQTNSYATHTSEASDRQRFHKKSIKTLLGEEKEEGAKSAKRREAGTRHRRGNGDIANSWWMAKFTDAQKFPWERRGRSISHKLEVERTTSSIPQPEVLARARWPCFAESLFLKTARPVSKFVGGRRKEELTYARGNPCKTRGGMNGWSLANKWWLAKLVNARGPGDEREGIGVHQENCDKDPHHHELGAQGTEQPRNPYAEFTSDINEDSAHGRSGKVPDAPQ